MTKQELLTKLAIECATWDAAAKQRATWVSEYPATLAITKQDWLAERERLLNKPSWADAPADATHKAMDDDGEWCFYIGEPTRGASMWCSNAVYEPSYSASSAIAIPAGYDWRNSLEERDSTHASCAACGHLMLKEDLNLQDNGTYTCTTCDPQAFQYL